jgi:hypothetical protein
MLGEQSHAPFFTHALELTWILKQIPKMSLYVWDRVFAGTYHAHGVWWE